MYFIEKTVEFDKWFRKLKDIEKAKEIWDKLKMDTSRFDIAERK